MPEEPFRQVDFSDCIEALNNYGDAEREFGALKRPATEVDREKVRLAKVNALYMIDLISRMKPSKRDPEPNSEET